jgi:hypothetical protein
VPDIAQSIADYIASWNDPDPNRRAELIATVWREDGRYVDPLTEAHGREQIAAMIAAVQQQLPGSTMSLVGEIRSHHDIAAFRWQMVSAGGPPLFTGLDFALLDTDGRLRQIAGFWDPQPSPDGPPPG